MAGFKLSLSMPNFEASRKKFNSYVASFEGRQKLAVKKAALIVEREIKSGLKSGAPGGRRFKPLSLITLILRGQSAKPLLDKGDLLGSISTTTSAKGDEAFVGVHRTARSSTGAPLVNIARIHEFGTKPYTIPVTNAMRSFFWFLHFRSGGVIQPLGVNKTAIRHPGVPARPFIRPVIPVVRVKVEGAVRVALSENGGPI